ncbi:MAG TPA: methyltransferase domain-containing protein [Solirubrobacterales bacterium]|nr:methyltransferase domain-containing protein [Candidatus Acidoferrum sp.]HYU60196.1 methyltransferase domain-containing protein [Solirubrobacterales bacterium]
MESKALDPVEFRGTQRQQWDSAATGWRKWSELIDGATSGISERLVELAGVEPGSRVLDVAAGYGEPSLSAARAAGPEGSVTATDISAEMIAFGRERAAAAGLENIEFVESDAAGLDYPENSFDAALSRWGIIFEPDGEAAAARIRGFLKAGARMAISSWGPPEHVPMLAVPMRTAMERLEVPPPPPGTPGPLSRPTPEALGGLLEAGGFSDVEIEEAEVSIEWQSPEEFTTFIKEIAPPVSAMIDPHPPEVQEETWAAITEAIRQQSGDGGAVRLSNLALLAAGRA